MTTSEDKVQELMRAADAMAIAYAARGVPEEIAARSTLESALRAVVEDMQRVDWLEKYDGEFHNIDRITSIDGRGFCAAGTDEWHAYLRTAIDHARKGEKEGG